MSELCVATLGEFIGGGLLALLIVLARDWYRAPPSLSDAWTIVTKTTRARLTTFVGMELRFIAVVHHADASITGRAEKVMDKAVDQPERHYVGADRSRLSLSGTVRRGFFRPHSVSLLIDEKGALRESATVYTLTIENHNKLIGTFTSTISNSSGTVEITRGIENLAFFNFDSNA
jgi:hypothetical protein